MLKNADFYDKIFCVHICRGEQKMINTEFTPELPLISRYLAPWDADGWYYVCGSFGKKSKIYSNADIRAVKLSKMYEGAEYIVTFDSAREGKDDHQESDFYVERDATVTVAFDMRAKEMCVLPEWLFDGYADVDDEIKTDDGARYALFSKTFSSGAHVVVPGFSGNFRNYFILVTPRSQVDRLPIPRAPKSLVPHEPYDEKIFGCYISEAFNSGIPSYFIKEGDVTSVSLYSDKKYKSVRLSGDAAFGARPKTGKRIVAETVMNPVLPEGEYSFGAVSVKAGKFFCGELELCDAIYGIPSSVSVKYDVSAHTADIDINRLNAGRNIKIPACDPAMFSCRGGELTVDFLTLRDDTEVFISNEVFESMPPMVISPGLYSDFAPLPFEENKSLKLSSRVAGSCGYDFDSVSGTLSAEIRLFVSSGECVNVAVTGKNGELAASAALYRNNIFVGDGGKWKNSAFTGVTPYCYFPFGNWYELRFVLDTKKRTYDFWVDGAKRAESMRFGEKTETLSRLEFSCAGRTDLYINRIRIYDDSGLSRGVLCGKVFDVKKFGAKGNGKTDDTAAINAAVCAAAYSGGTVYLHDGTYLSGEISLASDMTFFLAPSAVLLGSQDHGKYPLREPGRSLCAHRQLGRALLYGENLRNVTVTGGGMIDGNGKYRFKQNDPLSDRRAEDARPDIVYIAYSDGITVRDINMRRSAFWTVVPLSSRNITVKNLRLDCMNTPNRDGIDPVDCHNITVCGCNIMAGDDGLCFKSSDVIGCKNIDVYDMMISSLASAVKFGTDTYYCLENARFSDCFIKNVNRCAVSLESVDGANVSDVVFRRFDITDASAPVYIVTGCRNRLPKGISEVRVSKMKNITFSQLNFRSPRTHGHPLPIYETMVVGQSEAQSIDRLKFEEMNIEVMGGVGKTGQPAPEPIGTAYPEYDRHGLSAGYAFTVRYAKGLELSGIHVANMKNQDARPLVAFFDCTQ